MSKTDEMRRQWIIVSKANKERNFGGLYHWLEDPSGGEELLESELEGTCWEKSQLLLDVGCSKLRW